MSRALPVHDEVPADFYERYVVKRQPVVVRGGARDWPAVGKWSPSFLKQTLGDRVVRMTMPDNTEGEVSLAGYLDRVQVPADEAAPLPYLRNLFLRKELPELAVDVGRLDWTLPNWLEKEPFASLVRAGSPLWLNWCEIFISQPRTRFPFVHVDRHMTHAWCVQIYGSKRYWAWPPRPGFQFIDCLGKDLETLFETEPSSVSVDAGDAIFIPAGWPHTAESVTTSISVSGNFVNDSNWVDFSRDLCEGALRQVLRGE